MFLKEFEKNISIYSSWNIGDILQWNVLILGPVIVVGRLSITDSSPYSSLICSDFLFTYDWVFVWLSRLYVSRKFSISSRLSNLLAYNYSKYSLIVFCISAVSVVISPLSFLFLFIWILLLFFLVSLARYVDIVYPFKKPAFGGFCLF